MKQIRVNDYKYPYVYSMGLVYFLFFNLIRATKLHSKNETNIRKPYIYTLKIRVIFYDFLNPLLVRQATS